GLAGLGDGDHYFDTIAKNAIFEFRCDIAGWPKRVESRDALMALYRGYGEGIVLHGGDGLVVHRCDDGRVVVIEYEVHENPTQSSADVTIDAAAIWTGQPQRDAHLRSADFLDVEHHP